MGDTITKEQLKLMIEYLGIENDIDKTIRKSKDIETLEDYLDDWGYSQIIYEYWYDSEDDIMLAGVGGIYYGDPEFYLSIRKTYHSSPSYGVKSFKMPQINCNLWDIMLRRVCEELKFEYKEPSWYVMVEVN